MKYTKLFLCLLCFLAIELQAQIYTSEIEVTNSTNGKVGIGTANPTSLLHLNGGNLVISDSTQSVSPDINLMSGDGEFVARLVNGNNQIGRLELFNLGEIKLWISASGNSYFNSGNVGIGSTSPSYQLDVNGTARVTTLIQSSDERLKKDIRAFSSEDKMNNLSVYKYKLKGGIQSAVNTMLADSVASTEPTLANQSLTKDHVGLMAQEVEAIYPDLVYTDQQGYKAIDYSQFIPILIDRTNKQEEKINSQQQEIDQLKKEMAELKILITSNK